ncbi:MAG: thioesterase family protein [Alphaproteobacteria bacterium]|nr:thioesterase family protein [Rhodospirillales bacterium]MCW9046132.1 thioesterase family protein [Alphaproteobacteria bacterium]
MSELFETYRGTVRREELDEMGHMNVAYYLKKSSDALANLRFSLGLSNNELNKKSMALISSRDRIFFRREVHLGDTLVMESGIRGIDKNGGIQVVNLLENQEYGNLAAHFETTVNLVDKATGEIVTWPQKALDEVAKKTGVFPDAPLPEPFKDIHLLPEMADKLRTTYQGDIPEQDTDVAGFAAPHAHIARFWTAFPNVMKEMGIVHAEMVEGGVGSTALDYRLNYHHPIKQGTKVEIKSCLLEMGEKVFRFVHFMTDQNTGEPVTTVDVLGVLFDLKTRKAIPFPDHYRKGGEALLFEL